MDIINISTQSKHYNVYIGKDILTLLEESFDNYSKLLIITDDHLKSLHLNTLKKYLPDIETYIYIAPNGEHAKSFKVYEDCLSFGLNNGLDRQAVILAFGGGAIGDLAGFVAATYMRGIAFIQVPTTILAHDSAIGGKVAINHSLGKNMVGAFYQPEKVIYDTQFLSTLPLKERRSGFAEVIKHALIADPIFLNELMNQIQSLETLTNSQIQTFLRRGIEIKATIVEMDERESNIRAYLNFGHTLGHALEANAGYGNLAHGEAVLVGMIYALYLSKQSFQLEFSIEDFIEWVQKLGYQWRIPSNVEFDTILEWMIRDKKSTSDSPVFVLLQDVGEPILQKVEESMLRKTFYLIQQ
jgi:3-dehydroquinate synthase